MGIVNLGMTTGTGASSLQDSRIHVIWLNKVRQEDWRDKRTDNGL